MALCRLISRVVCPRANPSDLFILPLWNLVCNAWAWEVLVQDPFNTRLQLFGIRCLWIPASPRLCHLLKLSWKDLFRTACMSVRLWGMLIICCRHRWKITEWFLLMFGCYMYVHCVDSYGNFFPQFVCRGLVISFMGYSASKGLLLL